MAYDDEQTRKSRVVVETPTARREVVRTETARIPERSGMSNGVVAALVIAAVALVTILFLFMMSRQTDDTTNANVALTQPTPLPQTTIVEQAPVQQPPIIIQQPAAAPQQAPIIVSQPAPASEPARASGTDDATVQSNIQKRFSDDPIFSSLGLSVMVIDGKATLTGTVKSEAVKSQIERLVRSVRGVRDIDNQILVSG
jgi:hyperosmotically inducible protein